jgi:two-component system chemotaxis response regulator CheB
VAKLPRDAESGEGSKQVRVLVVDDSALMRRLLCDLLGASADIEVVGTARDGREAVLQAARLKPDVITLDVEMPEVSGLDALPALLAVHEAPVIMVSALTQEGADVTLQALELGAVDFMPKPERNQLAEMRSCADVLISKVLTAASSRVLRIRRTRSASSASTSSASQTVPVSLSRPAVARLAAPEREHTRQAEPIAPMGPSPISTGPPGCLVIGISTGGPQALSQVFPLLRPPIPPILVVQHMPAQFTRVFAERLDRCSPLSIKEARDGDAVSPNQVLIAPGGRHMVLVGHSPRVRVSLSDDPPVSGHKPSVDVLFESAARVYHSAAIGIMMTGMGRDGVEGCKAILAQGGFTLGQDEPSSVVYGMNKAAFLDGALKAQFPLDELAAIIQNISRFREHVENAKGRDEFPDSRSQIPDSK